MEAVMELSNNVNVVPVGNGRARSLSELLLTREAFVRNLADLDREIAEAIRVQREELDRASHAIAVSGTPRKTAERRGRKAFSPEQRRFLSEQMKARWARLKQA